MIESMSTLATAIYVKHNESNVLIYVYNPEMIKISFLDNMAYDLNNEGIPKRIEHVEHVSSTCILRYKNYGVEFLCRWIGRELLIVLDIINMVPKY